MNDSSNDKDSLRLRLESLEAEISEIKEKLQDDSVHASDSEPHNSSVVPPPLPFRAPPNSHPTSTQSPDSVSPKSTGWNPEVWIGRIGVGLLILGVIFLFQYAVDRGWLGPWVRVSLGLVLGAVLLFGGYRLESAQRWFRQLLCGAAFAIWYLSVYAANQMYELIPGIAALAAVALLALTAYTLAIRERSGTISFLTTLGGMVSPLLLIEGSSISAIELLFSQIIGLMAMCYYCRRGGSIHIILVFLLGGIILVEAGEGDGSFGAKAFIQIAWLLWGSILFIFPAFRNLYIQSRQVPAALKLFSPEAKSEVDRSGLLAVLLSFLIPLIWFIAISGIWNLTKVQGGWVALCFTVLAFVIRSCLQKNPLQADLSRKLENTLLFHSVFFGIASIVMVLDGSMQLFLIASIGFATIQLAIMHPSGWLRGAGNFLFAACLFWTFIRVADAADDLTYSSGALIHCWIDFFVIVLAMVQSILPWRRSEATIYWVFGLPMTMLWLHAVFTGYEYSAVLLTLSWSLLSLTALVCGLRWKRRLWTSSALVLLVFVLIKLFIYDLSNVDAFWRMVLFILLGVMLLGTSYFISRYHNKHNKKSVTNSKPPELPATPTSALDKRD